MKQQDILILIVIIIFAGVFSFIVSGKFVTPTEKSETVEKVESISPEFALPSSKMFNTNAVNPTVRIQIAPNENDQPFSNGQ